MCEYCYQSKDNEISGKPIFQYEWKETAGYEPPKDRNDFLEMFILKSKNDKKAGLMIDSGYGYRYIDINYCPMCRKEARRKYMRGFNIGDFLQTRDGKHKGKVIKIENVIIENEVRIIITIRNDFEKYKADIDEFIIW